MSTETVLERVWADDNVEVKRFPRIQYSITSPRAFSDTASRASSTSMLPFRFSSQPHGLQSLKKQRETKSADFFSGGMIRRSSISSKSNDKGKDPVIGKDAVDSPISSSALFDADPFASHYDVSIASHETSRPTTTERSPSLLKKRGSLLAAASDALGFKFGRKRKSIRQPTPPMILPDVIEISAPCRDEEVEERERLRDVAAQSIGLGPVLLQQDSLTREDTVEEEDENPADVEEAQEADEVRTLEPVPNDGKSPHESSLSMSVATQPLIGRHRAGSMAHSRSNSTTVTPIPAFPSTPSVLTQFIQTSSPLPKYYPPSSLRIFTLSRHWKSRFMILSSPTPLMTRGAPPTVSYLHLFKSSGTQEKELERLEINEESVVFIAEEEVGGRKHVIKVGGLDVGALKKELNHEDGGLTMWFLQITDAAEAQKWITIIKNAILCQRSMRAGLGLPAHTLGGTEPRGDMDVMLSMRAQGIITSPIPGKVNIPDLAGGGSRSIHTISPHTNSPLEQNCASSVSTHSLHSQATVSKLPSGVTALKELFTGSTRPRSPSRAASIESDRQDREPNEGSFGSMGSNLLNMLRANIADGQLPSPTAPKPLTAHPTIPFAGPTEAAGHRLNRKIVAEAPPVHWMPNESPITKDRANRSLSLGAFSLQPPPRKRWTSIGPSGSIGDESGIYKQVNGNSSMVGSFGIRSFNDNSGAEPPASPSLAGFSFGTPEQKSRAPSIQSVSTIASAENGMSIDRSSSSTKRSSRAKRWSRQGSLPKMLTPPSGPPPSVPHAPSTSLLHPHPYAGGRPPSRSSSVHSGTSQNSIVSSLPSFSKLAPSSSGLSVNTAGTPSQSYTNGLSISRPGSSHRISIPPPRPAPTFALPPAPDQEYSKSDYVPSTKSTFRDSVANRAIRLSLNAPKPPPSTVLPPRPDELQYRVHRKSSSSGNTHYSTELYSIPASPKQVSPEPLYPPPIRPLPPTPAASAPVSRHASIKKRLRILSAPSPSPNNSASGLPPSRPSTMTTYSPTPITTSPPPTPIAEKITHFQNDPSFLQLYTPITPSLPNPKIRSTPPPPEQYPELTSLSPPPRRGSKQISILEKKEDSSEVVTPGDKPPTEGGGGLLSLSRPGSVISLGVVSM